MNYFVHETAIVDHGVPIGGGTRIWHFSHVCEGSRVGRHCNLGQNVYIESGVSLGDGVKIKNNVSLYSGVICEDDVFLGPSCVFTNVINPRSFIDRKHEFRDTLVRKGATVGANATVLCGCTIGQYALVGAGAVVTRDVADHALVLGVPARQAGWVCLCGSTLPLSLECPECRRAYEETGTGLREMGAL